MCRKGTLSIFLVNVEESQGVSEGRANGVETSDWIGDFIAINGIGQEISMRSER